MARVIAIINQKGGVGKTTTAINLGASLAVAERKTLLIDFDPQGNATSGLGVRVPPDTEKTTYHALMGDCTLEETLCRTELPELFVAPADQNLSGAEVELVNEFAREQRLKTALEPLLDKFHYILIDCPPSLGLLSVNALTAADSYLVPLQCEYFALEGLSQLLSTVKLIKKALNPSLDQEGILLTMFDKRNKLAHTVAEEVKEHFGANVFETMIPRNVRLSEAPSHGRPILLHDIDSSGALAYLSAAKEIIKRQIANMQAEKNKQESSVIGEGQMNKEKEAPSYVKETIKTESVGYEPSQKTSENHSEVTPPPIPEKYRNESKIETNDLGE